MDRYQVIAIIITMIVVFYYCSFSTTAESNSEEERTEVELPKLETPAIPKKLEISKIEGSGVSQKKEDDEQDQDPEESKGTFDLSFPGDNKVQSVDLFFERTYNTQPFKFKGCEYGGIEFKFNGNYFMTFQKPEPPSEDSIWKTLWASFSGWEFLSRSYTFRFEGSTLDKSGVDKCSIDNFGMGGYIEIEGDHTIAVDPHLHITLYPKWTPYSFVEIAVGGWAEVQQLGRALKCPPNLTQETCRDYSRYYLGLHIHSEFKYENERIVPSVMIEYLPHWHAGKYQQRFNISPKVEFKLRNKKIWFIDEFPFSIVLMGEIDYDLANKYSTIEPLIEINPWEVRWTQLVRHRF